jgi:hypothetical protein
MRVEESVYMHFSGIEGTKEISVLLNNGLSLFFKRIAEDTCAIIIK